jgi:hypothetical protein
MTTEHMNYLQGSFHSAVQDLRGILGLGVVHQGFEVVVEGAAVTVQPGLAFDHQGNRIVLDMPVTVEISFAPGEDTKYVCVKYDQIEDGEVEGRFTLVWDSCGVVLMPALPDAADNLVPIARVDRVGGNGLVEVRKIPSVEVPKIPSEGSAKSLPETPSPAPTPAQSVARTRVQQGVARLSPASPELSITLDFEPLSLSCHSTTAHGEATFNTDGVSQFVVTGSKLIEDAVGCFYTDPAATEILIKASRNDSGFALKSEEIRKTEDQGEVFEWEALVAWKALGESRG